MVPAHFFVLSEYLSTTTNSSPLPEQLGAGELGAAHVLIEEPNEGLVPDLRVGGLQDPMPLIGEVEELVTSLRMKALKILPEFQCLVEGHTIILVPVDHKHRCLNPIREEVG